MLRYAIHYQDKVAGQAELERQGMYYRVKCRCNTPGDTAYRIQIKAGEKTLDLGICTPTDDGIGIITRVPVREVSGSELNFELINEICEDFFEVSSDKPFPQIVELNKAKFVRRGEKVYISLH